ncbi:MAG: hypothetical protein A3E01_04490 [Gammaproteobacteria bacterium RIFCSPHIGHO2_12_FULL_63_22]|nr:MAG: hypothetical protein A3E01_04490 [Gammaproteobacteria bacterium RIFCSPHIGHO2_12_FULL_63_22]
MSAQDVLLDAVIREAFKLVDPFSPPPAGSYARGHHEGIIAALKTVRDLYPRAVARTYPFATLPPTPAQDSRDFVGEWHRRAVELGYDGVSELIAFALPCIVNSGGDERATLTQPQGGEVVAWHFKDSAGYTHTTWRPKLPMYAQSEIVPLYSRPHDSREAGDAERLDFLLTNMTYVGTTDSGLFAMRDWQGHVYGNHYRTPRQAIDAAIAARGQGDGNG